MYRARVTVSALPLRALCAALVLGVAAPALANGRPPSSVSVVSRADGRELLISTTFGVLLSKDGGCSFHWLCEQSIGFGGTFDPKYAIGADGTLYATTFEGLRISRDGGCTFTTATEGKPPSDPGALDGIWVDAIDLAPGGDVWIATAESGRYNDVYRSRDAGRTFSPMGLHSAAIWWKSVKLAPSAPSRIYVTGYQVAGTAPGGGQVSPTAHLRRSDDGGTTWQAMPLGQVAVAATPIVHVMAIDPASADTLYLRSTAAAPPSGDRLYRSTDGGASFTEVLAAPEAITAVVVRDRAVLAAVGMAGLYQSLDGGRTFSPVERSPHLACLTPSPDGGLLGCGTNWDPDFFAVGRSPDGHSWQKLFRFADMAGPLACPAGTAQRETCELSLWPSMREQFGATGPGATCPDEVPDAPAPPRPRAAGCCDGGGGGALGASGLLALGVLGARVRRRRPARTR